MHQSLKSILEYYHDRYNRPGFIENDPITIPHRFNKKEDIEIMGFLIAIIAWGQRTSIINSGNKLIELFQNEPHDFILNHTEKDLKKSSSFVHRTFNGDDLISLIGFLQYLYKNKGGLEYGFSHAISQKDKTIEKGLIAFRQLYETSEFCLNRTLKHIASPAKGSACKRLNMYLRWMVRKDDKGVDFGIWTTIKPSQLICPLDVHVLNQAVELGLLKEGKGDWKTAIELTNKLKKYDKNDPIKYDFALFGKGVNNE